MNTRKKTVISQVLLFAILEGITILTLVGLFGWNPITQAMTIIITVVLIIMVLAS